MKSGYINSSTYFEANINSNDVTNIFIHGVGLNHTMWKLQKDYFNKKSNVYYDLLNHGKTKKKYNEINFKNFNNQIIELISYLNIKKFNLIGFSLGALIAQHFASNYNDRINKLIIIASVHSRSHEQKIKVKKRYTLSLNGKSIADDSIKRWFNSNYLNKNPLVYKYFFDILKKNNPNHFLPAYKLFVESDKYKINFLQIKKPTLIITGENDIGATPEMSLMLSKKINKSKIYIVKKAKHMCIYEKAKKINSEIDNFIST